MRVTVIHNHTDREKVFEGNEYEVRRDLLEVYGRFLRRMNIDETCSLQEIIGGIDAQQAYSVDVRQDGDLQKSEGNLLGGDLDPNSEIVHDMHGYQLQVEAAFEAVRFLIGGPPAPLEHVRSALWEEDGDPIKAALRAYGLSDDEANRAAVDAVLQLQGLAKNESPPLPSGSTVEAAHGEGREAAEAVQRAVQAGKVMTVQLGGKHSKGSLVARDPEDQTVYLLKPGSGPQSPAAGAREDTSSQSQREAAFWHVAHLWGLGDDLPRCELLLINGKQYACMRLLGLEYKPLEKLKEKDGSEPTRDLDPYRQRGVIHRWAVLDFVLGNPDRHAANIMANPDGDVKLIDHGSAFAGRSFDPAYDRNSFVPFYLRYGAPAAVNFNSLTMADKLRYMQRASAEAVHGLREWIAGLHVEQLEALLPRYGIDPRACVQRLERVRQLTGDIDEGINRLWAGT